MYSLRHGFRHRLRHVPFSLNILKSKRLNAAPAAMRPPHATPAPPRLPHGRAGA